MKTDRIRIRAVAGAADNVPVDLPAAELETGLVLLLFVLNTTCIIITTISIVITFTCIITIVCIMIISSSSRSRNIVV